MAAEIYGGTGCVPRGGKMGANMGAKMGAKLVAKLGEKNGREKCVCETCLDDHLSERLIASAKLPPGIRIVVEDIISSGWVEIDLGGEIKDSKKGIKF